MTFVQPLPQNATALGGIVWLSLLLVIFPETALGARQVSAKRECATCHIMWLKEFNRTDVTPLVPYDPKPVVATGKQDVSSTERMCFSCHDGFVLDSRFMWQGKGHSHPVGVKPSDKMHIPTAKGKIIFPLNDDGKVYCGTCHTAHGIDWGEKISPIFLRVKNVDSSLCLACHLQQSTGPEEGNHPVFETLAENPPALLRAGSQLGDDGAVICETCHRTHDAAQKNLLVLNNKDSKLCKICHANKRNISNSKHDMARMAPQDRNIRGSTAGEDGPCSSCHIPHGAKGAALWARAIPANSGSVAAATCLSCHRKNGVAKKNLIGKHSHPVNVALKSLGIRSTKKGWTTDHPLARHQGALKALPLFGKNGERNLSTGVVSCPTCHDAHNWSVKEQARKPGDPRKLKGDGNSSFLRLAQDEHSILCLNCHVGKRTILATPHNPENLSQADSRSTPPRKKGVCESCHVSHKGKGPNLRALGKGPGSMGVETWCRDCHRENGFAEDKTIGAHSHPVGVAARSMPANAGLPLFKKSGVRTKKGGLVDCDTCHDPHQWAPQIAAESEKTYSDLDGDGSNSFLRSSAARDAPLCAQCHKQQALVRGTDHDMSVTAPDAVNGQGHNYEQSGVCGQCHAVHNPFFAVDLWARKPGKAKGINEQQCRSCHSEQGIAKAKLPVESQHPDKVVVWSGKQRQIGAANKLPDIPVYGRDGESDDAGLITCASCHDPHRWSPHSATAGKGVNEEGDAMSSFLRNASSKNIVCADCHGKDALFRYKYFHGKVSHSKHPLYQ